VADNEAGDPE